MLTLDHVTESEIHKFVAFASDLYDACPALRTGWPLQISTSIGNGMPLVRKSRSADAEGDTVYVRYQQANGCVSLKIFNT